MPIEDLEIQEKTMKQMHTRRKLMISGAVVAACAVAVPSASAQTTTSTTTAPKLTTAPIGAKTATPQMIDEAQQRSQARSDKLKTLGKPEGWGSEEPFTYVPR
jgi:hypothetical protein